MTNKGLSKLETKLLHQESFPDRIDKSTDFSNPKIT